MLNLYGVGATNGKSKRYQSILTIAFALLVLIFAVASSSASSSVAMWAKPSSRTSCFSLQTTVSADRPIGLAAFVSTGITPTAPERTLLAWQCAPTSVERRRS